MLTDPTVDIRPMQRSERQLAEEALLSLTDRDASLLDILNLSQAACRELTRIAARTAKNGAWIASHPVMIVYATRITRATRAHDLTRFVRAVDDLRALTTRR